MFYRRKLILAILECFGGQMPKINIQKIAFLITNRQTNPVYDFIPYKFGAYSYSANADISAMVKHGLLSENENGFTKLGNDKANICQCHRKHLSEALSRLPGWAYEIKHI